MRRVILVQRSVELTLRGSHLQAVPEETLAHRFQRGGRRYGIDDDRTDGGAEAQDHRIQRRDVARV